jgi:hypothetical protein
MPRPPHPLLLDNSNLLGEEYKLRSSSLWTFLHSPITSSLFSPSILLSTLPLKHPQPVLLRYRRRPTCTPIQNYRQNYSLCILMFMFFGSRREDRRFWTEWLQALPELSPLMYSWIKFWFVTAVPKYLNCTTFSNYMFPIFISRFWPAIWWRDANMYLVFSTFTSRPISILHSCR